MISSNRRWAMYIVVGMMISASVRSAMSASSIAPHRESADTAPIKPFTATTMALLVAEEERLHTLSPSVKALAQNVVESAVKAARTVSIHPSDQVTAVATLRAIQQTLARANFLQLPREDLWKRTLGESLSPHDASDPDVIDALEDSQNSARLAYVDRRGPFY